MEKENEISGFEVLIVCISMFMAVLKICGIINIDWIWVFSPMWIMVVCEIIIGLVFFGMCKISGKENVAKLLNN